MKRGVFWSFFPPHETGMPAKPWIQPEKWKFCIATVLMQIFNKPLPKVVDDTPIVVCVPKTRIEQ
jgi:hypothetical protein